MNDVLQCFGFVGEPSAVNQSWICLNNGTNNGTEVPERCFFLYHIQLGRRSLSRCGIGEAVITYFLLLCCIPANVANFVSFYRRQVKSEFLLLLAVYCICNVAIAVYGAAAGSLRITESWRSGDLGCVATFASWMILMTMSMWTMTIISYERKVCVCNWNQMNPNESRFSRIAIIMAICAIVNISLWIYPFFFLKVARVITVQIGLEEVQVCTVFTKTTLRHVTDIVYFLITFLIPLVLNIYNYWMIWLVVRRSAKASLLDKAYVRLLKRREINLAFVAGLTHVVFGVCTLPMHLVTFYIVAYDRYHNRRAQSQLYFAASLLITVRTIVSPLVMAFIRTDGGANRRESRRSESQSIVTRMSTGQLKQNTTVSASNLLAEGSSRSKSPSLL